MAQIPYRGGGANAPQLVVDDFPSSHICTHEQIDALLDRCVSLRAEVVRAITLGTSVGNNGYSLVTGVTGTGATTKITYNDFAWEALDYAVRGASQRGIYLAAPMVDEYGYYYGGKRTWVNFRRPGTCSTSPSVTSDNSSAQRAAESYFYTDTQIQTDFRTYLTDWLTHVNRYTGRANRDEPAIALVELGSELKSARAYPNWMPGVAAHIKALAPDVLVADGSAADGQDLVSEHLASPYLDVYGTDPYNIYGPDDVITLARRAAASNKAFWIPEYPWSKASAPEIERVARSELNVFTTAFWDLSATAGSGDGAYGTDDVDLHVPGAGSVEADAVTRLSDHHRRLSGENPDLPGGSTSNLYTPTWKETY